jgi:hypothetical protein
MYLRDYIPALKMGAKIQPQDIAGMLGLPYVGNVYYVDGYGGADTHSGLTQDDAFKTVSAAFAATTNYNHDVIVIAPSGAGSGEPYAITETAAIAWNKSLTHLIGNVAPSMLSPRAKIYTATAALSPFVTISGQGCIFKNVMFYSSATTNYINVRVSGNRNYFENVHFAGLMNATAGDNATGSSLELYGAQENVFVGCTIGADTVTRTAANANLRFALGSDTVARNMFIGCMFPMMADADAPRFLISSDTNGTDRWNLFKGCQFINAVGSTSTSQTDAFTIAAGPGGLFVLQDCLKVGTTGWADNLTAIYALSISSNGTYANGIGFAVNPGA